VGRNAHPPPGTQVGGDRQWGGWEIRTTGNVAVESEWGNDPGAGGDPKFQGEGRVMTGQDGACMGRNLCGRVGEDPV